MSTIIDTKQKIIDASISLFNSKGYDGTSVREISKKAKVNVSNISYYFEGKAGLLEFLLQTFFEEYLTRVETSFKSADYSAKNALHDFVRQAMQHHIENRHLARCVYREMTKDTTLIREVMTTYLVRERFFLKSIIEKGINQKQFAKVPVSYVIMQLKGFICMPFLQTQYISEVLHIVPYESYFVEQYVAQIMQWVESTICFGERNIPYFQESIAISI